MARKRIKTAIKAGTSNLEKARIMMNSNFRLNFAVEYKVHTHDSRIINVQ